MRWHRVSISCWPCGSDPSMGWEWGHSSTTAYSRAWCAAVLIACTSLLARGCFGAVLGVSGAEWGCMGLQHCSATEAQMLPGL